MYCSEEALGVGSQRPCHGTAHTAGPCNLHKGMTLAALPEGRLEFGNMVHTGVLTFTLHPRKNM